MRLTVIRYISFSSSIHIGVSPKLLKIEKPFSRKQYAEFSIASRNGEMDDDSTYVVSGTHIELWSERRGLTSSCSDKQERNVRATLVLGKSIRVSATK